MSNLSLDIAAIEESILAKEFSSILNKIDDLLISNPDHAELLYLKGICLLTVIPMRKKKSDTSEMINQILFGETFEIIKKEKNWSYIELIHDSYRGWIDNKQYKLITLKNYINKLPNKKISHLKLGKIRLPIDFQPKRAAIVVRSANGRALVERELDWILES